MSVGSIQLNYTQKYYEDLFLFSLENAYDSGLISHDEKFLTYIRSKQDISNFYVMNLSVLADSFEDVYYDITDVYLSDKLPHALGEDLDDIGDRYGCPRPVDSYARAEITFTFGSTSSQSTILPEGIEVSTATGIVYKTVEQATVPADTAEITITAQAVEVGKNSRVLANTLTKIDSDIFTNIYTGDDTLGNVSCTNRKPSAGGSSALDDDDYRELIGEWRKENIRGSAEAYHRYFSNLDGLNSYKLIPRWDGSGTLKIILDPGDSTQLNQVYNDLNNSVFQMPEDITLFAPEPVTIDVYARCNVDIDLINPYSDIEKEAIQSRIVDAIRNYVDGDVLNYTGLGIGEDFIPYQLGVFIHEKVSELKNIEFLDNNGNPTKPVSVSDEQQCSLGTVKIIME